MTEITLNLQDELIREYGELFIKKYFEKQLENLSLIRIMDNIEYQIKKSRINLSEELEFVRQSSWDEYKKDYFI